MDTNPTPPRVFEGIDLTKLPDYQEAFDANKEKLVYFGSFKGELGKYRNDLIENGKESFYFRSVFCPEKTKETLTNEQKLHKNMAFWAGLIDKGRPLLLMTNIDHYKKESIDIRAAVGGTTNELCWLYEHGYTFALNTEGRVLAKPPATPKKVNFINHDKSLESRKKAEKILDEITKQLDAQKSEYEKAIAAKNEITPKKLLEGKPKEQPTLPRVRTIVTGAKGPPPTGTSGYVTLRSKKGAPSSPAPIPADPTLIPTDKPRPSAWTNSTLKMSEALAKTSAQAKEGLKAAAVSTHFLPSSKPPSLPPAAASSKATAHPLPAPTRTAEEGSSAISSHVPAKAKASTTPSSTPPTNPAPSDLPKP